MPLITGPAGPTFAANQTLPQDFSTGVLSLSYGGMCTMGPGDEGKNAKSCSCWNRKENWYHDHAVTATPTTICDFNSKPWEYDKAAESSCTVSMQTKVAEPYTMPKDCCDRCRLFVERVHLLYFPPERSVNGTRPTNRTFHGAPSGIISDGQTFTSPSVYIDYTSVSAITSCAGDGRIDDPRWGPRAPIGGKHDRTILPYRAEQISSAKCFVNNDKDRRSKRYCLLPGDPRRPKNGDPCYQGLDTGWEAINFEELASPPPASVIYERKKSCFPSNIGFNFQTKDALALFSNPQISFPPGITNIDPVWQTWAGGRCFVDYLGAVDPPRTLGQASALAAAPDPTPVVTDAPDLSPPTVKAKPSAYNLVDPQPRPGGQPENPTSAATSVPQIKDHPVTDDVTQASPAETSSESPTSTYIANDPVLKQLQDDSSTTIANEHYFSTASDGLDAVSSPPLSDVQRSRTPPQNMGKDADKASETISASVAVFTNTSNGPLPVENIPAAITLAPQTPSATSSSRPEQQNDSFESPGDRPQGHQQSAEPLRSETFTALDFAYSIASTEAEPKTMTDPQLEHERSGSISNLPSSRQGTYRQKGSVATLSSSLNTGTAHGDAQVYLSQNARSTIDIKSLLPNQIVHMTNEGLEIGSQTLMPGGLLTISDHAVKYQNPTQLAIDNTQTYRLHRVPSHQPFVVAAGTGSGHPVTLSRNPGGHIAVSGATVVPSGPPVTIAGNTFSLATHDSTSIIIARHSDDTKQTYNIPPTSDVFWVQPLTTSVSNSAIGIGQAIYGPFQASVNSPSPTRGTPGSVLGQDGAATVTGSITPSGGAVSPVGIVSASTLRTASWSQGAIGGNATNSNGLATNSNGIAWPSTLAYEGHSSRAYCAKNLLGGRLLLIYLSITAVLNFLL